jgi:hypothetical protein
MSSIACLQQQEERSKNLARNGWFRGIVLRSFKSTHGQPLSEKAWTMLKMAFLVIEEGHDFTQWVFYDIIVHAIPAEDMVDHQLQKVLNLLREQLKITHLEFFTWLKEHNLPFSRSLEQQAKRAKNAKKHKKKLQHGTRLLGAMKLRQSFSGASKGSHSGLSLGGLMGMKE